MNKHFSIFEREFDQSYDHALMAFLKQFFHNNFRRHGGQERNVNVDCLYSNASTGFIINLIEISFEINTDELFFE